MGLDMYAHRRLYVKQWDHESADERYSVEITRGGKPVPGIQANRISTVDEEVMYWRKANHIHAWFVDNVQNGDDDQGTHFVDWDELEDLLACCKKVLKNSKLVDGAVYAGTTYNKDHPNGVVQRTPGKVIEDASVAKELLPTRPGFFFGSYEYDEYYLKDVADTHDWVVRMLADYAEGVPGDIYYSADW